MKSEVGSPVISDVILAKTELEKETNLVFYGVAVLIDKSGTIRASFGDPGREVQARSIFKIFRGLLLLEELGESSLQPGPEVAIMVGSHDGAALHRATLLRLSGVLGVAPEDTLCRPREPLNEHEALQLVRSRELPSLLHHECLGEHLGTVALCRALGVSEDYSSFDHPVNLLLARLLQEAIGGPRFRFVRDRCRMPAVIIGAADLGRAFRWIAQLESKAAEAIADSISRFPVEYAGSERFSSRLIGASQGKVLAKESASGGYVFWRPGLADSMVVFSSDGSHEVSQAVGLHLMEAFSWLDAPPFPGPAIGRDQLRVELIHPSAGPIDPG